MDIKTGPHEHASSDSRTSLIVYDTIYLIGRDLYAYCASDHTIGICKEKNSFGGKRIKYDMFNKIIFSNVLHLKLCWSELSKVLCSVASNNNIYGWDIDTSAQLFNVSRHNDVITDFLALDSKELFVTCSLDKRIVLWSMTSRRVKGVLIGHKRGIRILSVAKNTLLSAGFEVCCYYYYYSYYYYYYY
jgi:WD40 repeat protein